MSLRLLNLVKGLLLSGVLVYVVGCSTVADRFSPGEDEGNPSTPDRFSETEAVTNGVALPTNGWWRIYNDSTLDELVEKLVQANPDLEAATARIDRSFAILGVTRGPLAPGVLGNASASTIKDSVNSLLFPIDTPDYERYQLGGSASWELDLWGRVAGSVKRDRLTLESERMLYADTLLSLQANLVRQYFAWRSSTEEVAILRESIVLRNEYLELQQSLFEVGTGIEIDVARARVELRNAEAALEVALRRLGTQRHALAALVGVAPAELELTAGDSLGEENVPAVPSGVPSLLLQRRADLRASEKAMRAAAIQIGVKKVDFLPKITLVGQGGVASLKTTDLFDSGSFFFNLGPEIEIPIFGAGRRKAAMRQAQAEWREAVANYRSALLTAVVEVEDALLSVKSLKREGEARGDAVNAASTAASAAKLRHEVGLVSYFEFIDAERTRLETRLAENTLRGERWMASVSLIQSLGGSW